MIGQHERVLSDLSPQTVSELFDIPEIASYSCLFDPEYALGKLVSELKTTPFPKLAGKEEIEN